MTHAPLISIAPGAAVPSHLLTRHGAIYGATGTGKTTTAAALIERMADTGIPVLVLDAKGDMETLSRPLGNQWDMTGNRGHVRRIPVGEMGADLLTRALDLSPAQGGALEIAFAWAEDQGVFIETLEDLRRLLVAVMGNAQRLSADYGLITPASVAAVQRSLLRVERAMPYAFGGPELTPFEAAERDESTGEGNVTILRCAPLTNIPGLYGAVAAHILTTLYRQLGEAGESTGPGLCVFVDEAHLLFHGAAGGVVAEIERVVRLIRSKGVSIFFATQSPADLPAAISGQLATRIQHGLRAATGAALQEIRAAADSMPSDDWKATRDMIKTLGIGEALVSLPQSDGAPGRAQKVKVAAGRTATGTLAASYFPDTPDPLPISPTRRGLDLDAAPPSRAPARWKALYCFCTLLVLLAVFA